MDHRIIYLLHIFGVAPLFWYVGYNGPQTNTRVFQLLQVMAIITALYHGFKLMKSHNSDKFNEISNYTVFDNEEDIIDTLNTDNHDN